MFRKIPFQWRGHLSFATMTPIIVLALLILSPGSVQAEDLELEGKCIVGEKFVSVNGPDGPFVRNSVTLLNDPNANNPLKAAVPPGNLNDLPMAFFGGTPVFYEFRIRNCGTVDLYNVRLDDCADQRSVGDSGFLVGGANNNCVEGDLRLIPYIPHRIVADKLQPGESVTVTSADFPDSPISSVDICEEFGRDRIDGIVRNDSEVEGDADLNGDGEPDCDTLTDQGVCPKNSDAFTFFDDLNLVQCKEEGGEGCTPGFWKQTQHFAAWLNPPYAPGDDFSDFFDNAFPGMTLLDVLEQGGGGLKALGRHTVAALLNAATADVSYDIGTPQDVIDAFNEVFPGSESDYNRLKNEFENLNKQGCPINGKSPPSNL